MKFPDLHQITKWAVTAVIFMAAAFCIAYCSNYNKQTEQLAMSRTENKILTDSNKTLQDTIDHAKQELAKLLRHQEILRQVLENHPMEYDDWLVRQVLEKREQRIKELQSDVYKRIQDLEQMAQDDADVDHHFSVVVPDVVWDKIIRKTFTCPASSCQNRNDEAESSQTVPSAVQASPTKGKDSEGAGGIHNRTPVSE